MCHQICMTKMLFNLQFYFCFLSKFNITSCNLGIFTGSMIVQSWAQVTASNMYTVYSIFLCSHFSFIYLKQPLYLGQVCGGLRVYQRNTGCKAWTDTKWNHSPSQGIVHRRMNTFIQTQAKLVQEIPLLPSFLRVGQKLESPKKSYLDTGRTYETLTLTPVGHIKHLRKGH